MQIQNKPMKAPTATQQRWDLVEWQDTYSVGNGAIDADHKRLFELFNEFASAVNNGEGDAIIQYVLKELLDYTDYHFDREERFMRESSYPGFEAHKKMHDDFINQIHDVNNHMDAGGEMGAFVLEVLTGWLSRHILGADKQLGEFLAKKAA